MSNPTTFTWPLIVPAFPGGIIPSGSYLAPGGGIATCTPEYFTEEDLLAILESLLPDWYLQPLKDPGPGYEVLQAFAKTLERVSLAIGRMECSLYVISSHGESRATGTIEFYRASLSTGAFTVKKGTICRTSKTNRSFRTTADVAFGLTDYVVSAECESVGFGAEYNVPGPLFTADGTLLPGEIDRVVIPLLDPTYAEPDIQVRQVSDMVNGQAAVLDQLGLDRDLPRLPQEDDEHYKGRIRALPDTVSIDAIKRTLDSIFLPMGLHYKLIETWQNEYNSCWNQPDTGPTDPIFGAPTQLAYNDSRTDRFIPRWMSERDHRGAFVVILPDFPAFKDRGMAYNDTATTASDTRGVSAWSSPVLDATGYLSGVYNGDDDDAKHGRATFVRYVWDLLRQIKGAGVSVAFFPVEVNQVLP